MTMLTLYLPWVVLGVAAAILVLRSASRPLDAFALGAISVTATAGLAINGWTVSDEVLLGAILGGCLMSSKSPEVNRRSGPSYPLAEPRTSRIHAIVFVTLCVYLVWQGFRGMVELFVGAEASGVTDGLRKIRWPVFFLLILGLFYQAQRTERAETRQTELRVAVAKVGIVYMLLYVLSGVIAEYVFGLNRYSLQPGMAMYSGENLTGFALFGSSAYAMFPTVVVAPAGLLLVGSASPGRRRLGAIALGAVLAAAIYYESRVSLFCLAALVAVSVFSLRVRTRRALTALAISAMVVTTAVVLAPLRVQWLGDDLLSSGGAIWSDSSSSDGHRDIDRVSHFQAGLLAVNKDWTTFLVGRGYRMSSYIVGTYFYDLMYKVTPTAQTWNLDNFATEGFTSLLIDSGWLGIALLALCAGASFREVSRRVPRGDRLVLLVALGAALGWMFVINMLDIVLFYLLIMPNGLLVRLGKVPMAAARRAEVSVTGRAVLDRRCTSRRRLA